MVRENTHGREIELPSQPPNHVRGDLAQALLRRLIGQNNAEEYRPLAAPVFADVEADAYDIRRQVPLDFLDGGLDFGLFRDCGGNVHLHRQLTAFCA